MRKHNGRSRAGTARFGFLLLAGAVGWAGGGCSTNAERMPGPLAKRWEKAWGTFYRSDEPAARGAAGKALVEMAPELPQNVVGELLLQIDEEAVQSSILASRRQKGTETADLLCWIVADRYTRGWTPPYGGWVSVGPGTPGFNVDFALEAIRFLGEIGSPSEAWVLIEEVDSGRSERTEEAGRALTRIDPAAARTFQERMAPPNAVLEAILGRPADPAEKKSFSALPGISGDRLQEVFRKGSPAARAASAYWLRIHGAPAGMVPDLIATVRSPGDKILRRDLLIALSPRMGEPAVFDLFREQIRSEERLLALTAIDLLAVSKGVVVSPLLQPLARAWRDPFVRARAAIALGRLKDVSSTTLLSRIVLKKGNPFVRKAALLALGGLGPEAFLPTVERLLPRERVLIRLLIDFYERYRIAAGVPVLTEMAKSDPDVSVRHAALRAARSLCFALEDGAPRAKSVYEEIFASGDAIARCIAVKEFLGEIYFQELALDRYRATGRRMDRPDLEKFFRGLTRKEILDALLDRLILDPSIEVSRAAARVLALSRDREAGDRLIRRAGEINKSDVRAAAAAVLGRSGSSQAIPFLSEALHAAESEVRHEAAVALGYLGAREGDREARSRILEALSERVRASSERTEREGLVESLARVGREEAVRALAALWDHPEAEVRAQAALRVADILGKQNKAVADRYSEAFRKEAAGGGAEIRRLEAIWVLGKLRREKVLPVLKGLVATEREKESVRLEAAVAVGRILQEKAASYFPNFSVFWGKGSQRKSVKGSDLLLFAMKESGSERRRVEAIDNFRFLPGSAPIEAIGRVLLDEEESANVRRSAAVTLGTLGSKQTIPYLRSVLRGEDRSLALLAIRSAGQTKTQIMAPEIIECLKDKDQNVREAASDALGRMKAKAAVPAIVDAMIASTEPLEQHQCREALIAIQDPSAVPPVIAILKDLSKPTVLRNHTLYVLQAYAGPPYRDAKALAAMQDAMKDPNRSVISLARILLGELEKKQDMGSNGQ